MAKQRKIDGNTGGRKRGNKSAHGTNGSRNVKVNDVNHSCSTPCCQLARDVAVDIFPDVCSHQKLGEGFNSSAGVVEYSDVDIKKKQWMPEKGKQGHMSPKQQSLLGKIIRRYLLEKRKLLQKQEGRCLIRGAPGGSSGGSKKKKRKKKKKLAQSASGSANTGSAHTPIDDSRTFEAMAPPQDSPCSKSETAALHKPCDSEKHGASSNPSPLTQAKISNLDMFFDQVLKDTIGEPTPYSTLNRDLDSFVAFLNSRYQSYRSTRSEIGVSHGRGENAQNTAKKKRGNSASSKKSLPLREILPTVSISDVTNVCETVCCRLCRTSALAYLRSCIGGGNNGSTPKTGGANDGLDVSSGRGSPEHGISVDDCIVIDRLSTEIPKRAYAGSLVVPVSGKEIVTGEVNMDVDRAFDYVAMEEGCIESDSFSSTTVLGTSQHVGGHFRFELRSYLDDNGRKTALQLQPRDGECECEHYPLSVEDIRCMICSVLLPCGMQELDGITDERCNLTEDEMMSINKQIQHSVTKNAAIMQELNTMKLSLQSQLDQLSAPTIPSSFDAKTSTALQRCDRESDRFLALIVSLLWSVTELGCRIVSAGNDEIWAMKLVEDLWVVFNSTARALIKPALSHRGRVMQLANRPGAVPQMFLNTSHRSSYKTMLDDKLRLLWNMHEKIDSILLSSVSTDSDTDINLCPSALERLSALEAFFFASGMDDDLRSKIDENCIKLLEVCNELTGTIHRGKVDDIVDDQSCRWETAEEMNRSVQSLLMEEMLKLQKNNNRPTKYVEIWDELASQYKALKSALDEGRRRGTDCAEIQEGNADADNFSSISFQEREMRGLFDLARVALAQWRVIRRMQNFDVLKGSTNFATRGHQFPRCLRKKLADHKENKHGKEEACEGGGGKRRVTCILAALLYRWLCDRCMEWHADLTQSELLGAMDEIASSTHSSFSTSSQNSGQRSKKSSKKKKDKQKHSHARRVDLLPVADDLLSPRSDEKLSLDSDKRPNPHDEAPARPVPACPEYEPAAFTEKQPMGELSNDEAKEASVHTEHELVDEADPLLPQLNSMDSQSNERIDSTATSAQPEVVIEEKIVPAPPKEVHASESSGITSAAPDSSDIIVAQSPGPSEIETYIPTFLKEKMSSTPLVSAEPDPGSSTVISTKVGITDGETFQSAEVYLTQRLLDLLD